VELVYLRPRVATVERDAGDDVWVDRHWPALGLRGRFPPSLCPVPSREGQRRGLVLTNARDAPWEFLVLMRVPGGAVGGADEAWRGAAARLMAASDGGGAVVIGPYPVMLDGMRGRQGWLRFSDRGGRELVGLLWVGRMWGDRVTVAYGGEGYREPRFAARYRRLLDGMRWTAVR